MDRLTAIDASFLGQETASSHMHIGAILIFEGPAPAYEDLLDHISGRLNLVPRYRQKLADSPLQSARPFWVDDPDFNLAYHVRHSALPAPGGSLQLRRTAARIFSQQLDRSKPLWELWLVQGLRDDRFALISKTHHAVVDGISGVDIATVLFDFERQPEPTPAAAPWKPSPQPSAADLVARNLGAIATEPLRLGRRLIAAIERPAEALRGFEEGAQALSEVAAEFANPAPEIPLNVPIGPHRRFDWVAADLGEFKRIKNALGGTVNDIVLTVVAGALRGWLRGRGVRTAGLELRALVPVSTRSAGEHDELGNRITAVRGPLPVYVDDALARLSVVREAMNGIKASKKALGAEVIARFNDFAPPTLLAQASRINFSTRLFNLIVTNVPGPQMPLYVLGRELKLTLPVAFLPPNHALSIAVVSYNGTINFGLLADYDALDDLDRLAAGIRDSIAELAEAASATRAASSLNNHP